MSAQVSAVEKARAICSRVMLVAKVLAGLTTTARASVPTRNSIGSRPMARQDSVSLSLMGRLALAMSDSPATQNRSRPAPEPMESMVMLPLYPSLWNRSAIRSVRGKTVELPAVTMSPVTANGSTAGSPSTSTVSTTV